MWQTIKNSFADASIRKRIIITLLLLLVYRVGCFVPVPGLDFEVFSTTWDNSNNLLSMLNTITGGSLQYGTLFALGIVPFINASIIMQLLTLVIPKLERLSKDGEDGRKKINQYSRYLSILLAIVQAIGIVVSWRSSITGVFGSSQASQIFTMIFIIIILTGGSSFVMWLGERITEYGIGNGTSLLIFVGILATLGGDIWNAMIHAIPEQAKNGTYTGVWFLLGFVALIVVLFGLIVFVDNSERRIPVQYAKQIKGNKMYGGQSTHIPIKVNSGGVMPIIFASSLIMFPQMIMQFADPNMSSGFVRWWYQWMGVGGYLYGPFMFLLIIFFAYFYAQIQFNPDDVARMIQQNGGFIPGIRAGKSTSDYLRKINNRITLFGAIYLGIVALIPTYVLKLDGFSSIGLNSAFTATGLLIVVSVALELDKQLQSQLLIKNNRGFLK
jgi:preprotein translocase subunit SecY